MASIVFAITMINRIKPSSSLLAHFSSQFQKMNFNQLTQPSVMETPAMKNGASTVSPDFEPAPVPTIPTVLTVLVLFILSLL